MAEDITQRTRKVVKNNQLSLLGTLSAEKKKVGVKSTKGPNIAPPPPVVTKSFGDHMNGLHSQMHLHKEQLKYKFGFGTKPKTPAAEEQGHIDRSAQAFMEIFPGTLGI